MDTGRIAILVVAGVAILVGLGYLGLYAAIGQSDIRSEFTSEEISFKYEPGWSAHPGEPEVVDGQRVVAHVASFGLRPDELCTRAGEPCLTTGETMPEGEVSIVITAWTGGTPPIPAPTSDFVVGGEPAPAEVTRVEDVFVAWWQLSPPDFPDRWIEVRADFRASHQIEVSRAFVAIQDLLATVEFDAESQGVGVMPTPAGAR